MYYCLNSEAQAPWLITERTFHKEEPPVVFIALLIAGLAFCLADAVIMISLER